METWSSHTGSLDDELAEKIREQVVCSEWCRLKVWSRLLQLKVVRPCILSAVKNRLFLGISWIMTKKSGGNGGVLLAAILVTQNASNLLKQMLQGL